MTHVQLSECSVRAPIRKGREGNWKGGDVLGTTSIDLTVGAESPPEAWMATHSLEDWDPPCDYSIHDRVGNGAASLVVIFETSKLCGCAHPPIVYFCLKCWVVRGTYRFVYCVDCGANYAPFDGVIRVEPLR